MAKQARKPRPWNESVWRRAYVGAQAGGKLVMAILGVVSGALVLAYSIEANRGEFWTHVGVAIGGATLGPLAVYLFYLAGAPFKQRDEARGELERLRDAKKPELAPTTTPVQDEIGELIEFLEEPKYKVYADGEGMDSGKGTDLMAAPQLLLEIGQDLATSGFTIAEASTRIGCPVWSSESAATRKYMRENEELFWGVGMMFQRLHTVRAIKPNHLRPGDGTDWGVRYQLTDDIGQKMLLRLTKRERDREREREEKRSHRGSA